MTDSLRASLPSDPSWKAAGDRAGRRAGLSSSIPLDAWPLPALVVDVEADEVVAENAAASALLGALATTHERRIASAIAPEGDRAAWQAALRSRVSGSAVEPAVPLRVLGADGARWVEAHLSDLDGPAGPRVLAVLVPLAAGPTGSEAERAVAAAEARWRGRTQELEAVREEEQKRIARELHDRLGADLSLLRIELARVAPKLSWARRGVKETVERMRDHAGELLETVRRISRELRPRVLDHVGEVGLTAVLEHVAAEVHRSAGFLVHLDARLSPADDAAIDPARAEAAYHVVREALNNVVRHSGATRAVVSARVEPAAASRAGAGSGAPASLGALVVEVLDDGRGVAAPTPGATAAPDAGPEGIGWWSLSERVRAFGGEVSVRAEPGVGTTVSARIPLGAPR